MRASNSPPKRLSSGFVSPGKTISVTMVSDSFGVFVAMQKFLNCLVKIEKDVQKVL
jgi:hypothetical protein